MQKVCPICRSKNIKKNGKTHYKRQNHKCKCCGRQLVRKSTHLKSKEQKSLIKKALKERLSLRAISRIFGVSLRWAQYFAQSSWRKTPKDSSLKKDGIERIKRLQVFGIQADESWSFVDEKKRKRWIGVAYDPVHRLVTAHHIGGRGERAAEKFLVKIPSSLKNCNFETDHWEAYKSIIPEKQHKIGKDLTYFIEGFNATARARVSRLIRKTRSFSKTDQWHNKAIIWFFWQFNLERQPYI